MRFNGHSQVLVEFIVGREERFQQFRLRPQTHLEETRGHFLEDIRLEAAP
jgi:hypothetical protein